ncbi:MAG: AMP-binding protein, partial [Acidimicrobiales bacterium]
MYEHTAVDVGLGTMIGTRTKLTPNRAALTFEGSTWTYAEFLERIDRFAGALIAGGVAKGDRVAYIGLNHPAFFVTLFAASRVGATFVPLNFRLTGPELTFIVGDAGATVMVADAMHKDLIDSVRDDLPCNRYFGVEAAGE